MSAAIAMPATVCNLGTQSRQPHYQPMAVKEQEKATYLRTMADQFRQTALESMLPAFRAKLLQVAVDLDCEAARLGSQRGLPLGS